MTGMSPRRGGGRRLIGYARVSSGEGHFRLQLDALRAAGCARIFRDNGVSAIATDRPGLARALNALGPSDVLVVWRLDRVGRSLHDLIELLRHLSAAGHGFCSVSERIDTGRASGQGFLPMLIALADFESSMLAERTRAGLDAARGRGKRLGRRQLMTDKTYALALRLIAEGVSRKRVAAACGVSVPTLYRELAKRRAASANASETP